MIRSAVKDDLDGINVMHTQLHIQHIGYRPDIFAPIEQPVFDTLMLPYLTSEDKRIIISENDGIIDGYAAVAVMDTGRKAGEILPFTYVSVDELCVLDGKEHNGIGTALLDAVKRFGAEIGAKFVELGVNAQNTGAQEFYKANGMFVKNLVMQYRINEKDERKE